VDADGGEPVRVTGDEFMDVSPAWLDDEHLLFISNRDGPREVYIVEVGVTGPRGEPRKVPGVIDAHSISYSIAGRKLAFSKANERQNIWSYPIGSGPMSIRNGHPVTSDNAVIETHDISPDGEWIVYHSNLRGTVDIYKKPIEGGSQMPITDSPMLKGNPRWSPDGAEIAFVREVSAGANEWAVMVVSADGGTPSEVADGALLQGPIWSPSGLEIAFMSRRTGQPEIWIVSRDTTGGSWGEARQFTEFGCVVQDWEPNGNGVLCSLLSPSQETLLVSRQGEVLWRYDLATAGLRRWYWGYRVSRFSRDGSTMYLSAYHEDGSAGIWAIPVHGGEPSLVVESTELMPPFLFSVGPDHLYVTVGEHESDIWVMDVEVER
jgi:dipeptidyl aminopeptidase/acylaminoacyl peptidase